jgi:hypothetical protein
VVDLICIERELGVVKVYGGKGGIALGALGDLGGLRVVYKDGEAAENDSLDFEKIVEVDPDCVVLALTTQF